MADANALIRSPVVVGAGAVLVIAAVVAGGYFLGSKKTMGMKTPAAVAAANRSVCEATMARAEVYGVLEFGGATGLEGRFDHGRQGSHGVLGKVR